MDMTDEPGINRQRLTNVRCYGPLTLHGDDIDRPHAWSWFYIGCDACGAVPIDSNDNSFVSGSGKHFHFVPVCV